MSIPGKLSSWGCCLWLFSEGVGHLRTLSPLVTVLWDLQEKAPLATVARPWRGVAGSSSRNQSSRRVSELPSRRYWSAGASKKTLNLKKKKLHSKRSKVERERDGGACQSASQRAPSRPQICVRPEACPSGRGCMYWQAGLTHTKSG